MTQAYQRRIRRPTAQRQTRTSDQWEVYYDAQWRKASESFLRQYPLCVACLCEGRTNSGALENPSQRQRGLVVDHIIPHRGDRNLFWDQRNWETLCRYPCHDQVKQQCDIRGEDWFATLRRIIAQRGTRAYVEANEQWLPAEIYSQIGGKDVRTNLQAMRKADEDLPQ